MPIELPAGKHQPVKRPPQSMFSAGAFPDAMMCWLRSYLRGLRGQSLPEKESASTPVSRPIFVGLPKTSMALCWWVTCVHVTGCVERNWSAVSVFVVWPVAMPPRLSIGLDLVKPDLDSPCTRDLGARRGRKSVCHRVPGGVTPPQMPGAPSGGRCWPVPGKPGSWHTELCVISARDRMQGIEKKAGAVLTSNLI